MHCFEKDSNINDWTNKKLTFKNNAPVRSCISKINNTLIENPEDLDIIGSMFDCLENSGNCSMTSGSFWTYYKDVVNDDANENNAYNTSRQIMER